MEDIIGMAEMGMIFEVTDDLGIDRESIRVDLTKEDPGSVQVGEAGMMGGRGIVEIVVPLSTPLEEWLPTLKAELQRLGVG